LRILPSFLMLIVAVITMPQTSSELHALYGKSDSEVFNVRPGILLSWLDAPSADMNKMTEVLDEVVPPNQRGKEVGPGPFFGIHCYGAATPIEYENVIINSYYNCEKPVKFSGFEVRFKRPACDKVKPETFPPPGGKLR